MNNPRTKNLRYNYTINLIEASFWGLGSGLSSTTAILPLFLLKFTDSALLIGLIPAIQTIGFQLPQLFTRISLLKNIEKYSFDNAKAKWAKKAIQIVPVSTVRTHKINPRGMHAIVSFHPLGI